MITETFIKADIWATESSNIGGDRVQILLAFNIQQSFVKVFSPYNSYESAMDIYFNTDDADNIYKLDDYLDFLAEGESGRIYEEIKGWMEKWL